MEEERTGTTEKTEEQVEKEPPIERGKYQIEVRFSKNRSGKSHVPSLAAVSVWRATDRFVGGATNELMFICRSVDKEESFKREHIVHTRFRKKGKDAGCFKLISPDLVNVGNLSACPHCGLLWDSRNLTQHIFFMKTAEAMARELHQMFHHCCDGDADIMVWYSPNDLRLVSMAPGDQFERQRLADLPAIYPLGNIIRDSASGADHTKLFKAFLLA